MKIEQIIALMGTRPITTSFIVVMLADIFFGVLRAFKQKVFNSSFGIDGAIRKVAMIGCIVFLFVVDYLLHINFIGWMPTSITQTLNINSIGLSTFFAILFMLYESVSVLKNLRLLGLNMPKFLDEMLNKTIEDIEHINKENK